MQSSESTVNGSTVQSPIVDIILQLPCILTCTLKACILAHFRSLGINPVVESRGPNPNTAISRGGRSLTRKGVRTKTGKKNLIAMKNIEYWNNEGEGSIKEYYTPPKHTPMTKHDLY